MNAIARATATTAPIRTSGRVHGEAGRSFTDTKHRFRSGRGSPAAGAATIGIPGRLAQLGEHQLDKLGVTGSSPVPPIRKTCKRATPFAESTTGARSLATPR